MSRAIFRLFALYGHQIQTADQVPVAFFLYQLEFVVLQTLHRFTFQHVVCHLRTRLHRICPNFLTVGFEKGRTNRRKNPLNILPSPCPCWNLRPINTGISPHSVSHSILRTNREWRRNSTPFASSSECRMIRPSTDVAFISESNCVWLCEILAPPRIFRGKWHDDSRIGCKFNLYRIETFFSVGVYILYGIHRAICRTFRFLDLSTMRRSGSIC